ncbi:MAG TPA: hypothetical protein DCS93_02055 [Microscillaceae bacterium]|nr:hypothetical protein [Microscillaceae bacterium]
MRPKEILVNLSIEYEHFMKTNKKDTLKKFIINEMKHQNTGLVLLKKYLIDYHHFSSLDASKFVTYCAAQLR